jgi:hypothetical protein
MADFLDAVSWDERGLVPAIAQDAGTGRGLLMGGVYRAARAAPLAAGLGTPAWAYPNQPPPCL